MTLTLTLTVKQLANVNSRIRDDEFLHKLHKQALQRPVERALRVKRALGHHADALLSHEQDGKGANYIRLPRHQVGRVEG